MNIKRLLYSILLINCYFFTSLYSCYGQDIDRKKIDSTLQVIQKLKDPKKINEAYAFIASIAFKNKDEANNLFNYIFSKDSTENCLKIIFKNYGLKFSQKGDSESAINYYKKGLQLALKLKDEYVAMQYYAAIGNSYQYLNKIDLSLENINKGQEIAEKPENNDFLWYFYYLRALIKTLQGDTENATYYGEKMWEIAQNYGNTSTTRFILYYLVDYYLQLDEPEKFSYYTQILANYYEDANPNTPEGHMPIKMLFENAVSPKNIPKLIEAIEISDRLNNINSMSYSAIALADTYKGMGQPIKAIPYLQQSINKVSAVKKPLVLLNLYTAMQQTQSEANNYKEAYYFKVKEANLRDSIFNEKMQHNIAELEVKFDTEQKERKIAQQSLQIEKETQEKNRILFIATLVGLLLIGLLFFYKKRLKYQKTIATQKQAIQQQEIKDLEQKNKLLALNSMIEGQEAERLRIAKDLHDSLGGLLSTVKAHFTTIQKEIEQLEKFNLTEKTNQLIDEACIEVRRISHNMMPHALSIAGLKGALEDLTENLQEEGYTVNLETRNLSDEIDATKQVMLYRLIQEIISNVRKHAQAKSMFIQLIGYKNTLNVLIEDDGKGFNYQEAITKGGLGLKSINSRVQFLDGTIDWDTQPGKGTTISINIPEV